MEGVGENWDLLFASLVYLGGTKEVVIQRIDITGNWRKDSFFLQARNEIPDVTLGTRFGGRHQNFSFAFSQLSLFIDKGF